MSPRIIVWCNSCHLIYNENLDFPKYCSITEDKMHWWKAAYDDEVPPECDFLLDWIKQHKVIRETSLEDF